VCVNFLFSPNIIPSSGNCDVNQLLLIIF
jgi:hypothetical protein